MKVLAVLADELISNAPAWFLSVSILSSIYSRSVTTRERIGADAVKLFDAVFERDGASGRAQPADRPKMCACGGSQVIHVCFPALRWQWRGHDAR